MVSMGDHPESHEPDNLYALMADLRSLMETLAGSLEPAKALRRRVEAASELPLAAGDEAFREAFREFSTVAGNILDRVIGVLPHAEKFGHDIEVIWEEAAKAVAQRAWQETEDGVDPETLGGHD